MGPIEVGRGIAMSSDAGESWFWLLLLGAGAIAGAWAAFRSLHLARLLEDTPTSRIRSAAQGYVELAGRGEPLPGTENPAPLTQRPCVWWSYRIERRVVADSGAKRRQSWRIVQRGESAQPFLLVDDTGQCLVDPRRADVLSTESTSWSGSTPWPTEAPGAALTRFGVEREYRYTERRIYAHERLHALGDFRTLAGADGAAADDQIRELLLEWKADRHALVERFDTDRDGEISMAEWEAAHAEARAEVTRRRAERPATPAQHLLAAPADGRRFLLAAFSERELVRRYRRRAMLAFAGVFAATCGLGWLLGNWFGPLG